MKVKFIKRFFPDIQAFIRFHLKALESACSNSKTFFHPKLWDIFYMSPVKQSQAKLQ